MSGMIDDQANVVPMDDPTGGSAQAQQANGAADDLTEAQDRIGALEGIENHPHGFILLRVFRLVKIAATRLKALEDRVTALENKP